MHFRALLMSFIFVKVKTYDDITKDPVYLWSTVRSRVRVGCFLHKDWPGVWKL